MEDPESSKEDVVTQELAQCYSRLQIRYPCFYFTAALFPLINLYSLGFLPSI